MIIREQQPGDYDAIRHVYAQAFRQPGFRPPQDPGSVAPEVGLFDALREADDTVPGLSFTALTDAGVVGHVTASKATVTTDPVVAVGAGRSPPGASGRRASGAPEPGGEMPSRSDL